MADAPTRERHLAAAVRAADGMSSSGALTKSGDFPIDANEKAQGIGEGMGGRRKALQAETLSEIEAAHLRVFREFACRAFAQDRAVSHDVRAIRDA